MRTQSVSFCCCGSSLYPVQGAQSSAHSRSWWTGERRNESLKELGSVGDLPVETTVTEAPAPPFFFPHMSFLHIPTTFSPSFLSSSAIPGQRASPRLPGCAQMPLGNWVLQPDEFFCRRGLFLQLLGAPCMCLWILTLLPVLGRCMAPYRTRLST